MQKEKYNYIEYLYFRLGIIGSSAVLEKFIILSESIIAQDNLTNY